MFIENREKQNKSPIGANYVLIILKSVICVQIEYFYRKGMIENHEPFTMSKEGRFFIETL